MPSAMKLLGDARAPRWARRLQTRIGQGDPPARRAQGPGQQRASRTSSGHAGLVAGRAAGDPRPRTIRPIRWRSHLDRPARVEQAHRSSPALEATAAPAAPSGASNHIRRSGRRRPPTTRLAAAGRSAVASIHAATNPTPPSALSAGRDPGWLLAANRPQTAGDPAEPTAALPIIRSDGDDLEAATEQS